MTLSNGQPGYNMPQRHFISTPFLIYWTWTLEACHHDMGIVTTHDMQPSPPFRCGHLETAPEAAILGAALLLDGWQNHVAKCRNR